MQPPPEQHSQVYTHHQFDQNLDMLDPHMDAITPYSPMYTETTNHNGIVKQIITNTSQQPEPNELSPNDFLQMVDNSHPVVQNIQMVPDQDQDVDILITDQATGISYLVERCLNDSQLMDTDVLLDSDLLSLDENVLKSQLAENITEETLGQEILKTKENNEFVEHEEDLVLAVQQICDRPIQTRARASLPVSHLVINKNQRGGK